MRRLLLVLALLWGIPAFAQSTIVSGTITDAGGQIFANGTVQFTFRPADSNPTAQYLWNGAPFDKNTTIPTTPQPLDNTGSFAGISVPSSNFINPSGSTWTVKVCPASTTACSSVNLSITGATQNISAQIIPPAINLNLTVPFLGARAYQDTEVTGALPGTLYFNLTDNRIHVCLQTGFPPCTWFVENGGSGTVSSVSSGNFSPLFNVTVTNPTTTPAFSFSAQNAPPGTIFGNPGGAPAVPSFNTPGSFSGIGTVTNIATSAPISGGPIMTTGTISCPTCVTSVSGTANQITSSGGTTPTLSIPATFIAPGSIQATTSLTGTSVTDSGLTSGNCVQAAGGGLLSTTSSPCAASVGVTKIQSATTPGAGTPCTPPSGSSFDACNFTFTWPSSFADASYQASCLIGGTSYNTGTAGNNFSNQIYVRARVAGSMTLTVQNLRGAADTPATVECIGVHP